MALHFARLNPNRPPWLGGGQWILTGLREVTVLFGRNGSGKSQLLRALKEGELAADGFYTSPERAGPIAYDHNVMQQELVPGSRGQGRRNSNLDANYRRESVSRLVAMVQVIGQRAGRGEPVHEGRIIERVERQMAELLPEFQFKITDEQPYFKLYRVGEAAVPLELVSDPSTQLSSGEAEVLTVALDLLSICNIWELEGQGPRVLLIDEPDPHLHPDLQARFARFLFGLVDTYGAQALVATHSTTLLAAIGQRGRGRVGVIYLNNAAGEQQIIAFDEVFEKLAAVLGGHALIGPLFGAPLLLVEGDDDYQIWSQVPRQPGYRGVFAVLPAGGEQITQYQSLLEALFASIRPAGAPPAGFALIDGDKGRPTHVSQDHVGFLQLQCREAENLYLTDEVLNRMGKTWAEARAVILERSAEFGERAQALAGCEAWDRKTVDLKGLMSPLAELLDPKQLLWTVRVGQALGERRPVGQLAEFLGDGVVEALWSVR